MMAIISGILSAVIATLLGLLLYKRPESPSAAYIVFAVFAAVPVALLLIPELQNYRIGTPEGAFELLERKVNNVVEETVRLRDSLVESAEGKPVIYSSSGLDDRLGIRLRGANLGESKGKVLVKLAREKKTFPAKQISQDSIVEWKSTLVKVIYSEQEIRELEDLRNNLEKDDIGSFSVQFQVITSKGEAASTPFLPANVWLPQRL